jgi:hypothetical protein
MTGSFNLGLVELFSYLLPGCLTVAGIIFRYWSEEIESFSKNIWLIVIFLIIGFIFGHLLTMLSVSILKIRPFIFYKILRKKRHDKPVFYQELIDKLIKLFGEKVAMRDEYQMSLRIVSEFMPNSANEINRLYALTLFSRNLIFAFLILGLLFLLSNLPISIFSFVLGVLFIIRYTQLEAATGITVRRSAYVYLCMKKDEN